MPRVEYLKCPTCHESLNNHCCRCGRIIPSESQTLRMDAFNSKTYNDTSLHLLCDPCNTERTREVQYLETPHPEFARQ